MSSVSSAGIGTICVQWKSLSPCLTGVGRLAVVFSLRHGVSVRRLERCERCTSGVVETNTPTPVAVLAGTAARRIELEAMGWRKMGAGTG